MGKEELGNIEISSLPGEKLSFPLTNAQIIDIFDISRATIYAWEYKDIIPPVPKKIFNANKQFSPKQFFPEHLIAGFRYLQKQRQKQNPDHPGNFWITKIDLSDESLQQGFTIKTPTGYEIEFPGIQDNPTAS